MNEAIRSGGWSCHTTLLDVSQCPAKEGAGSTVWLTVGAAFVSSSGGTCRWLHGYGVTAQHSKCCGHQGAKAIEEKHYF